MPTMSISEKLRTNPKLWVSAGLLTAGLASGIYLGGTLTSGAATTSSTSTTSGSTSTPPSGSWGSGAPAGVPSSTGLPKSGTVTAVGSDTVTIDGTAYAVTSSSDIDKNGEATLSDLAVGDKVTFSTTSATTPTIDKLHAGNESLDRPSGPPMSSSGAPSSSSTPPSAPSPSTSA